MRDILNDLRLMAAGWFAKRALALVPEDHPSHGAAMDAFRALSQALGKT